MKYLLGVSALLTLVSVVHAAELEWAKDAPAAFAAAKAKKCLVMVDFDKPDEPFCKKLNETGLKDPRLVGLSKGFVALRVDVLKEGKALAQKMAVTGYPCVVFANADGTPVSRLVGYVSAGEFVDTVQVALEIPKGVPATKAKLASKPNDGEANAKMATYLCAIEDPMSGKQPTAEPYLEKALKSSYHGRYLVRALIGVGTALCLQDGKEATVVAYYQKALQYSNDPEEQSTIMATLMTLVPDKATSKSYAEKIVALKGASPDWVEEAKQVLKELGGKS